MSEEEHLPLVRRKIQSDPLAAKQGNRYVVCAVLILLLVVALILVGVLISTPPITFPVSNTPMGSYNKAAVACDNGYCSTIGKLMLQKKGSAVDAAIAAAMCDGVINMHNLGIAGGAYIVIWDSKTRAAHTFDAYSVAPLSVSEDLYLKSPSAKTYGKYAIAVPGHMAGLYEAHRRFGRLPWTDLLQPSINLCERGFKIGPALAAGIAEVAKFVNLTTKPEEKHLINFLTDPLTGKWYKENDTLKCPVLANSLKIIAKEGPMTFYNGTLGNLVLQDFAELGVPITKKDLLNYQVNTTRKPFELTLPDGLTVYTPKPACSGAAAAFVLNILSGYKFTSASSQDPLTYYRFLEAEKFTTAQILNFGDLAFTDEEKLEQHLTKLSSLEFGQEIRKKINDNHALPVDQYMTLGNRQGSTSHISVLDEEGSAFSMTTTINFYFGSHVMGSRTGIVFNNAINNFAINGSGEPSLPLSFIAPGKRPTVTLSPMIFVNRSMPQSEVAVRLVVGSSGSSVIVSVVPYVAMRALWFGETVKQAVDAGRLSLSFPNVLNHEEGFLQWVLDFLRERGYEKQEPFWSQRHSICQAIQRLPNDTILAMSDFRKELSYTDGY